MTSLGALLSLAVVAFVTTNVDDLVALAAFSRRYRYGHVLLGQVIGFSVLVGASLALAVVAQAVFGPWIGLLGVVPMAVGVAAYRDGGGLPFDAGDEGERKQVSVVAAVGVANGADNLAVYVPLFAVLSVTEAGVVSAAMVVLSVLWVGLAVAVVRLSPVRRLVDVADRLVPLVFVGIGLYVVVESGLLTHLAG